jgi:hypothetical protein
MGTINIQFGGICVHFQRTSNPILPIPHRTVLINGHTVNAPIIGQTIPPHFALLSGPGMAAPLPLDGVKLSVANAPGPPVGPPIVYGAGYQDLPNLTSLIAGSGGTLGGPSVPVLLGHNPALVSCYFDFETGTFGACTSNDAAGSSVVVTTLPTDCPVVINVEPFPTAAFPPPLPQTLSFPSGSTITVQNVSAQDSMGSDTAVHFYLSYLTAAALPAALAIPQTGPPACPIVTGIAGPGCSDSNYP